MKHTCITFAIMSIISSTAMSSQYDLNNVSSPAPIIDLRGAKITRSTKDGSTAFSATSLKGHSHLIKIQKNLSASLKAEYEGEHFFTSAAGSYFSEELDADYAHQLFNQCTNLYAQQEAKKRALSKEKNKLTNCSLQ